MADEATPQPAPTQLLSTEQYQALNAKGALSDDFMQRQGMAVYNQLRAEEAADANNVKQNVANHIATAIANNPDAADVAKRVQENLKPDASPSFLQKAGQIVGQGIANAANVPIPILGNHTLKDVGQGVGQVVQGIGEVGQGVVSGATGQPLPAQATPTPQTQPSAAPMQAGQSQLTHNQPQLPVSPDAAAAAEAGDPQAVNSIYGQHMNALADLEKTYQDAGAKITGGAAAVSGEIQKQAGQMEKLAQAQQQRIAEQQKATEDYAKKINDDVDSVNKSVDPNRMWNNMSTFGKVGSVIGVFLGGLKAPGNHSPNQALEIIQKAIDRDIDAQKADIQMAQWKTSQKENLLSKYIEMGHSEIQAADLARASQYQAAQLMVESAKVSQSGINAQAELSAKLGELKLNAINKAIENGTITGAALDQPTTGDWSTIPKIPKGVSPAAWWASKENRQQGVPINGVGIVRGGPRSSVGVNTVRAAAGALGGANKEINNLLILAEKNGVSMLPSSAKTHADTIRAALQTQVARLESATGAPTKSLTDIVDKELPPHPLGQQWGNLGQIATNTATGENQTVVQLKRLKQVLNEATVERIAPFMSHWDSNWIDNAMQESLDPMQQKTVNLPFKGKATQ